MSAPIAADRVSTLNLILRAAAERLSAAEVDSPRLVAEALLAHTLRLSRTQLLAHLERVPTAGQIVAYETLIHRCEAGEPLAYVLGRREFYGLDFVVDARVLIPRPETELLIDTALELIRVVSSIEPRIADIGTGSGAIAVTLAARLPHARIIATDISAAALEVARENARRHHVADRIRFEQGDLLAPIDEPLDLIAANLPYVRRDELPSLSRSIRNYEPAVALDGGSDGLATVRRLLHAAPRALEPGGAILAEIGAAQGEAAREAAQAAFPFADIQVKRDIAGLDRLLVVRTGDASRIADKLRHLHRHHANAGPESR